MSVSERRIKRSDICQVEQSIAVNPISKKELESKISTVIGNNDRFY
jgi:hypothetical protein